MHKSALLPLVAILTVAANADGGFSKKLSLSDFSAAGLSKLTPAELAKLDELIAGGDRQSASAAVPDSRPGAPRPAKEGTHALSVIERAKVILSPGTQIEYTAADSTLAGSFRGWNKGTIFTLEHFK